MLSQLFQSFTQAPQGQQAVQQLARQGVPPNQAMGYLQSAFPAAAAAFQRATTGGAAGPQGVTDVGQSHYVTNFLSGAVSGLLRGEGIMGAAVDGLQGVVGGHVAQVIATRFGLPQRVAGTIGAIVTPLIIDFLWDRVRGGLDLGSLLGAGGLAAGGAAIGAAAMSAAAPTTNRPFNAPFAAMGNALPGGIPGLGAITSAVTSGMGGAGAASMLGGLGSLLGAGAMAPGAFTPPSGAFTPPSTSNAAAPSAKANAAPASAATVQMPNLGSIFQMFGGSSQ